MADLKVGAPLACGEYDDDWNDFSESTETPSCAGDNFQESSVKAENGDMSSSCNSEDLSSFMDSFLETGKSGSLEDLVNTFDKKLSECFGDYKNNVSTIAPVQVRSQEEIINGCQ